MSDPFSNLVGKRKLVKVGGSLMMAIPPEFIEHNKLNAGDEVLVQHNGNVVIITMVAEEMTRTGAKFDFVNGISIRTENGPKQEPVTQPVGPIDNETVD